MRDSSTGARGPLQFGIGALLIVQAAVALFLGLLLTIGVLAILIAFAAAVLVEWGPFRIRRPVLREMIFDVLAGAALPVLCLRHGPLTSYNLDGLRPVAIFVIGPQILVLLVWLVYAQCARGPNALMAGMLSWGFLASLLAGALLLPVSVHEGRLSLGVLRLAPFLTAYAFGRNVRRAIPKASSTGERISLVVLFGSGFYVGGVLCIVFYAVFGGLGRVCPPWQRF